MIRFLTAGESHGPALTVIVEGIPAGLKLDVDAVTADLRRRQKGYGRGLRMRIERDTAIITSGLWKGETIGSPITVCIQNKDWKDWKDHKREPKLIPRPGHADLVGYFKYDLDDIQKVIERSSARETTARVAAGNIARQYLDRFGVRVYSHTRQIGTVVNDKTVKFSPSTLREVEKSKVRCADRAIGRQMMREIDVAAAQMDTLGGVAEVVVTGVPPGLGSYAHWDRRADARLAAVVMSIQSVKAVEIGEALKAASSPGSVIHDPIVFSEKQGFRLRSNNSGGVIGGMTTGEEIVLRTYFKPIPTLGKPLASVHLKSKQTTTAPYIRSDVCVVPAGGVVCEAAAALVIADLMSEKFGGDSIREALSNYRSYVQHVRRR